MTHHTSSPVKLKRIYEAPARSDGYRVLVDRIWPRGVSKEAASLHAWLKDVAPSTELRGRFSHDPSKWSSFKREYLRELEQHEDRLAELIGLCARGTVTLVFAARDIEHNNAVALKEHLDGRLESRRRA